MKQVTKISISELQKMAEKMDGNIVKAVVDVTKKLVEVDAPMHFDIEQDMLEKGSKQDDLWGFNYWPAEYGTEDFIEFDSMINIRPRQGNRSRYVENAELRKQIFDIAIGVIDE